MTPKPFEVEGSAKTTPAGHTLSASGLTLNSSIGISVWLVSVVVGVASLLSSGHLVKRIEVQVVSTSKALPRLLGY